MMVMMQECRWIGELKVKTCSAGPLCLDLDAKDAVRVRWGWYLGLVWELGRNSKNATRLELKRMYSSFFFFVFQLIGCKSSQGSHKEVLVVFGTAN